MKDKGIPAKVVGELYILLNIVLPPADSEKARKMYEDMKNLNFNRAETDVMFKSFVDMGAIGEFTRVRKPTPVDTQNVVRMNRDTQYSFAILDLSTPVEIIKPDADDRFLSL